MMKRLLIALCACLLSMAAKAGWPEEWDDCSARTIQVGRGETFTSEETFDVSSSGSLTVEASKNGGIRVRGWTWSGYRVTVCRAAEASSLAEARPLLDAIRLERDGGRLSVNGPSSGLWVVHFVIEAPVGATMNLRAHNGPLSVRDYEGEVELDVQNGPISLSNVQGRVNARADNGPINLLGGAGEMTLRAQNGPLTIDLEGASWNGVGLEGSTKNGPLTVKLDSGFLSGVLIETEGHSPVKCDPDVCDGAKTRWSDDGVQFLFGGATPTVKLSTRNGPLTIRSR